MLVDNCEVYHLAAAVGVAWCGKPVREFKTKVGATEMVLDLASRRGNWFLWHPLLSVRKIHQDVCEATIL